MEFITYEQEGFVGVITINRPKALNALNSQVLEELETTFKAVELLSFSTNGYWAGLVTLRRTENP